MAIDYKGDPLPDPEDETFWREIREAVRQVSNSNKRALTVQIGHRKAYVHHDYEIVVRISETRQPPQELLIP